MTEDAELIAARPFIQPIFPKGDPGKTEGPVTVERLIKTSPKNEHTQNTSYRYTPDNVGFRLIITAAIYQ